MAFIPAQQRNNGLYVPTTYVFSTADLNSLSTNSPAFKDLIVRLYENINSIILSLNQKESALYFDQEFADGAVWQSRSSVDPLQQPGEFRRVYTLGTIGAGVTNIAHGLSIAGNANWELVSLRGAASNNATGDFYPLGFASASGINNIELRIDNTNIVITNNSGVVFPKGRVVIEFLEQ